MSKKYSDDYLAKVRTWYVEEGRSDGEIMRLSAALSPRMIVNRNQLIGIRNRARPPIVRPGDNNPALRGIRTSAKPPEERRTKPAPPPAKPKPAPIVRPAPAPIQTPAPPPYERKASNLASRTGPTLLELETGQCRNPVGSLSGSDQQFCGDRVGTRRVMIKPGVYVEKLDSYCQSCGDRNRVGTSTAASLIRSARAYA